MPFLFSRLLGHLLYRHVWRVKLALDLQPLLAIHSLAIA